MGLYDKGTYEGGDNYGRNDARERFLELLERQRSGDQAMADKLRREEEERTFTEDTNTNTAMLQGGQAGSAFGPWGALVGGIAGRVAGGLKSVEARRQKGESGGKAAFNAFLNPVQEVRNLGNTLKCGAGTPMAGTLAGSIERKRDEDRLDRVAQQMAAQEAASGAGGEYQLEEPGALEMESDNVGFGQGDLSIDPEYMPDEEDRAYYGRYGR